MLQKVYLCCRKNYLPASEGVLCVVLLQEYFLCCRNRNILVVRGKSMLQEEEIYVAVVIFCVLLTYLCCWRSRSYVCWKRRGRICALME